MPSFEALAGEYAADWKRMRIAANRRAAVERIARGLLANKGRYASVAAKTGVSWLFIAVIHQRESDADFTTHLHNGDPLSARTRHVPAGRPLKGRPPFTWEESAIDALEMYGLDRIEDWPLERIAYECEGYNGWGYRNHGVPSAYLWSFSNIYRGGKYVADGVWDGEARDAQCGTMPMLKALFELDTPISLGETTSAIPATPQPPPKPPPVKTAPVNASPPRPSWRVFLESLKHTLKWRSQP
jgi:lysozyme family protein